MFHWSDSGQITSVHASNAGVLCVFYLHLLNQLPSLSENVHRATEDVPTTNFEGYNMPKILLIITKHQNMETITDYLSQSLLFKMIFLY